MITGRQCEIAAEAWTTSLLAQTKYDVWVQYDANQPGYDLVAIKKTRTLRVSVKGTQVKTWPLAVNEVKKGGGYHWAIDNWLARQNSLENDLVFVFVGFKDVEIGQVPRVYVARPSEIAEHMKTQYNGKGHGALHEDYQRHCIRSKYNDKLPVSWEFNLERIDTV